MQKTMTKESEAKLQLIEQIRRPHKFKQLNGLAVPDRVEATREFVAKGFPNVIFVLPCESYPKGYYAHDDGSPVKDEILKKCGLPTLDEIKSENDYPTRMRPVVKHLELD